MAQPGSGMALRHVHTLFNIGTMGGLTDGQLLERFTSGHDEAAELAFAALVERHGPMVLRVCQSSFAIGMMPKMPFRRHF